MKRFEFESDILGVIEKGEASCWNCTKRGMGIHYGGKWEEVLAKAVEEDFDVMLIERGYTSDEPIFCTSCDKLIVFPEDYSGLDRDLLEAEYHRLSELIDKALKEGRYLEAKLLRYEQEGIMEELQYLYEEEEDVE